MSASHDSDKTPNPQAPPDPIPEGTGQAPPNPDEPGRTPSAPAPASAPGRAQAVDHDWVFKNLVQDYPQAALAFFAAGEKIGLDDDIEITFLGQEPPEEQMTEGKQILDMPMRVRWRDGSREDLVILLEEETIPSRFNPERLLSYTVRVMRREGTRRALPIVICLERGKMEAQLSLGGDHLHPLQFRIPHWHLASMDAAAYAESPNILARIMTVMMCYPHTPEARVRVYGQAWKGILALEPDPDRQLERVMDSFVPALASNPCADKAHCAGKAGRLAKQGNAGSARIWGQPGGKPPLGAHDCVGSALKPSRILRPCRLVLHAQRGFRGDEQVHGTLQTLSDNRASPDCQKVVHAYREIAAGAPRSPCRLTS